MLEDAHPRPGRFDGDKLATGIPGRRSGRGKQNQKPRNRRVSTKRRRVVYTAKPAASTAVNYKPAFNSPATPARAFIIRLAETKTKTDSVQRHSCRNRKKAEKGREKGRRKGYRRRSHGEMERKRERQKKRISKAKSRRYG